VLTEATREKIDCTWSCRFCRYCLAV